MIQTKLRIMLECIWDGNVHLKNYGSGHTASAALQWEAVYIVLQVGIIYCFSQIKFYYYYFRAIGLYGGRPRLILMRERYNVLRTILYWSNLFGKFLKPPSDQLLLFGHAGVTHASPVDIREVRCHVLIFWTKLIIIGIGDRRRQQINVHIWEGSPRKS